MWEKKYSNTKFHENPLNGSRIILCGRTDILKPIGALGDFVKSPNTAAVSSSQIFFIHSLIHPSRELSISSLVLSYEFQLQMISCLRFVQGFSIYDAAYTLR